MPLCQMYAFQLYLSRDNITELFEDNQHSPETAVAALSELPEKPIVRGNTPELQQQGLDKAIYANSRYGSVLRRTAKSFADWATSS
ncbi:hypothetical protein BX616_011302, partial [Lobosporangium transversale]